MLLCTYDGGRNMEAKLTLKLDALTIDRAKRYVVDRKDSSLSKLVETYFKSLTTEQDIDTAVPPIVSSLAGIAGKTKGKDTRLEYTEYLERKYQ